MDKPLLSNILVAMPAYNEEKYIGSMVLKCSQYAGKTLVIDDGSTDRTTEIARLAGATVIRHGKNRGYGSAIRSIMAEAKRQDADILIILDADSQHNPEEIPYLVSAINEGSDIVIGSREAQKKGITPYRRFGQRVLSRLTHIASRKKLYDTESGFRAYSRKALAELELKEKGMAISSEIIFEAAAKGLNVTEVPISVTYTEDGSTLNPFRHGFGVLFRILSMISVRRPLLFFGLGGLALVIVGLVMGIVVIQMFATNNVLPVGFTVLTALFLIIGMFSIFTSIILHVMSNVLTDSVIRALSKEREKQD
jgi:glycosyltransferase involved in cell wall biosynthesis